MTSSDLYQLDTAQRFGFVLTKNGRLSGGPPVEIGFARPGAKETGAVVSPVYRGDGLESGRGVYVTDTVFDVAGTWAAAVRIDGKQFAFPIRVGAKPNALAVGAAAPRAASPTPTTPLGVDPICTRRPACSLHTQSLDTMIGAGRPTVVLFATPARCQTAYCGPVLELVLAESPGFQDRINVAHVEIYHDTTSEKLSPTVEAWGLASEPWLYSLDPTGRIVRRLDGAFDRTEVRNMLTDLVN